MITSKRVLQINSAQNQRAVAVDNLRVVFERQLKPGTDNFGKPWENLTAVVRAENVNAVQNVSKRLNVTERRRSNSFIGVDVRDKEAKASVNILGTQRTFDNISKDLNSNQRYVTTWTEQQGLKLATELYVKGKAPLKTYFYPPSIPSINDLKKKVIKKLDSAVDSANIPKRIKNGYKETLDKWKINPRKVAEDSIIALTREINLRYNDFISLEFINRRFTINLRKRL